MMTDCGEYLEDPYICDYMGEPKGQCANCGYKWYEHELDALPECDRTSALEIQDSFDTQTDKIRADITKRIADVWDNPNLPEQSKIQMERILNDQSNRLEIARRIHNHYVLTGKVKIPD